MVTPTPVCGVICLHLRPQRASAIRSSGFKVSKFQNIVDHSASTILFWVLLLTNAQKYHFMPILTPFLYPKIPQNLPKHAPKHHVGHTYNGFL